MNSCPQCNKNTPRQYHTLCSTCETRDYRARKKAGSVVKKPRKPKPTRPVPTGDLLRDELVSALYDVYLGILPRYR